MNGIPSTWNAFLHASNVKMHSDRSEFSSLKLFADLPGSMPFFLLYQGVTNTNTYNGQAGNNINRWSWRQMIKGTRYGPMINRKDSAISGGRGLLQT